MGTGAMTTQAMDGFRSAMRMAHGQGRTTVRLTVVTVGGGESTPHLLGKGGRCGCCTLIGQNST